MVDLETPTELLGRLKLGREEFCQRLLTSLILQGPYPRWNTRSKPSPSGLRFLRTLHQAHFGDTWPGDDGVFVDEFELAARHAAEKGGAPDYAVVWGQHLWLIELKTEKGSHRAAQVPSYFELGRHHHPASRVDLLYVTPPMSAPFEPAGEWARYAHVTWAELAEPIRETWPTTDSPSERAVVDGLLDAIDSLATKPGVWRAGVLGAPPAVPAPPEVDVHPTSEESPATLATMLDQAMALAAATAADGQQRAVDTPLLDLDGLLELRLAVRDRLAMSPDQSPLRHVQPWLWRTESAGAALTPAGLEHGMELRLSRYRSPLY